MSIQNDQPDSKQQHPLLVDPGMLQFTLAIAVIGFLFTSSNSDNSKIYGSMIFLGCALVTLALFFVYIFQWGVQHIPAFEELSLTKHDYSIIAIFVLTSYTLVSGAILAATILSVLALDLTAMFSIIFVAICFAIPGIILAFGVLLFLLKTPGSNRA